MRLRAYYSRSFPRTVVPVSAQVLDQGSAQGGLIFNENNFHN